MKTESSKPSVLDDLQVRTAIVGVIGTLEELRLALERPEIADIYEWRVDALLCEEAEAGIAELKQMGKPIILTVRDSEEGGRQKEWDLAKRLVLLLRYLPLASMVDVEANSVSQLLQIILTAKKKGIATIISSHFLECFPSVISLDMALEIFRSVEGDLFKAAVLVKENYQMEALAVFVESAMWRFPGRIVPMAVGELFGRSSRQRFAHAGAPLVYCSLRDAIVPGQWSAVEFRKAMKSWRA